MGGTVCNFCGLSFSDDQTSLFLISFWKIQKLVLNNDLYQRKFFMRFCIVLVIFEGMFGSHLRI